MDNYKIAHADRKSEFDTGAYLKGVLVDSILFFTSQTSVDFRTTQFILGNIEEGTKKTIDNSKGIIETGCATIVDVVKCCTGLADIKEFYCINSVYSTYLTTAKPARTTIQPVLSEELKLETDCFVQISA